MEKTDKKNKKKREGTDNQRTDTSETHNALKIGQNQIVGDI